MDIITLHYFFGILPFLIILTLSIILIKQVKKMFFKFKK